MSDGTITLSGDERDRPGPGARRRLPAVPKLARDRSPRVPSGRGGLRAALDCRYDGEPTRDNDGVTFEVSRLSVTTSGVEVGASDDPDAMVIGVNREFLLQALEAGDQLTLGLDDPIAPLAIRNPDREGSLSILMPVRLDQPA